MKRIYSDKKSDANSQSKTKISENTEETITINIGRLMR
jgi:hypothetical protein